MNIVVESIKTIGKENIATQRDARQWAKQSERTVRFPLANIVIRKGFNLRTDLGDLDLLADSIETSGLQEALTVDILENGKGALTDGERRYRAILKLVTRSAEMKEKFEYIDVKTNERSLSEADRIIAMMAHNSGKPFEPLEEADGFQRLQQVHKMNLPEIAKRVGKSVPYVEQRLLLASADEEEKESIRKKQVSPTAQVVMMRKEKDPAKRKAAVKASVKAGKKLKVKDIKVVPLSKKADEGIALVKQADKLAKDGSIRNILFEIDALLREIKKNYA